VYLSYDSVPKPPEFLTDRDGVVEIPEKRARAGGWVSIIAVYWDEEGTKYMGALKESEPTWPVTIQVAPR